MARRRHHRRRRYSEYVQIPGLGFLKPVTSTIKSNKGVLVGAAAGVALSGLVRMGLTKAGFDDWVVAQKVKDPTSTLPDTIAKVLPGLSAGIGGIAAYFLLRKSKAKLAKDILVGASAAAVARLTWDMLKDTDIGKKIGLSEYVQIPGLSGYRGYNGYGYGGVIVDNPAARLNGYGGYGGVIVDNPAAHLNGYGAGASARLEALSRLAMQPDYEGLEFGMA